MKQITIEIIKETENTTKRYFKAYTDFERILSKLYREVKKGSFEIEAYTFTASTGFMKIQDADDVIAFIGLFYKNGLL